jgi:DNA-binding MarR family transcriptional regulator
MPKAVQERRKGEPQWLSPDEQRAWRALQVMQARLGAELARDLSLHSPLSYQDYVVLVALTDEPARRLRLFELGERLGWEKTRASHQVTRMARRGLVAKFTCQEDRRGAVVEVTEEGRRAIEAAAPSHVEAVRRLFIDKLTPAQLRQLELICEAVLSCLGPGDEPGRQAPAAQPASAGRSAGSSGRRSGAGAWRRSGGRN